MPLLTRFLLILLAVAAVLSVSPAHVLAAETPNRPCTVISPTTGLFYDLNLISLSPPEIVDGRKVNKDDRERSWRANGHDYGANFTVNICAPVIETVRDVVGVDESRWGDVGAYYERDGKIYSIGEQSSAPIFRGRRLVLNYTDGSPCPFDEAEQSVFGEHGVDRRDDFPLRRKSTIMSFLCDREGSHSQAAVSFVGTMDSCTYFFEVRSPAACGGVAGSPDGGLSPGAIFGIIALIAIIVYLLGGCAYQRTVMHQRGWRQCPNYSMWASILSFAKDFLIIALFSLLRCFSGLRSSSSNGRADTSHRTGFMGAIGGRGRGHRNDPSGQRSPRDVDAENRLIDQLDEEWDD